jgi:hypothetical protein
MTFEKRIQAFYFFMKLSNRKNKIAMRKNETKAFDIANRLHDVYIAYRLTAALHLRSCIISTGPLHLFIYRDMQSLYEKNCR